jgi:hypothetical protein
MDGTSGSIHLWAEETWAVECVGLGFPQDLLQIYEKIYEFP